MTRDLSDLTDLHLLILGALWAAGDATIAQIHASVGDKHEVSAKTIATLLGRLEKRGLVSHVTAGREGVYRAMVSRREVLMARVGGVLASVFAAEDDAIGAAAVRKKHIRDGDREQLLELLKRAERDVKGAE
jgi:predicted transcriptional regulator